MKTEQVGILQNLGLTSIESKTYLTLIELGSSTAGKIADAAHMHRRNTYDALEYLLQKGLVSYIISNNKKYWTPAAPEKLFAIIRENENLVSSVLNELTAKYNSTKSDQKVEVLEGLGGMKTFYNDTLKEKKDITILFGTGRAYEKMAVYMKNYNQDVNKAKIKMKILLNPDADRNLYKNYKYIEMKNLPKNFSSPTQIFIYGIKSAVVIWSENPIAILIQSKEITEGFRKYFEFLWGIAKE